MDMIKQILSFQVEVLSKKPPVFVSLIKKLQGDPDLLQLVPFTLNTLLADLIFDKFGIEEEDQLKGMNNPGRQYS